MIGIPGNDSSLSSGGISLDVPAPLLGVDGGRKSEVVLELMRCKQMFKRESLNLKNT